MTPADSGHRPADGPPARDRRVSPTMIASDMDRTLIYSSSALQLQMPDEQAPTLVCVEVLDGRPLSFLTVDAARRLTGLAAAATFVPITTRTVAQYRRIRFPGIAPAFAVTSNGGNILIDGHPDDNWRRTTASAIAGCDATLGDVMSELAARSSDAPWALKRRVGDDLFCYLVVEPTLLPDDFIESWTAWCEERAWRVSVQGRKIYAIPRPLTKERAMAEVARRAACTRILAAGDGALDAGFLTAADAGIRPPHGELASINWQHPSVTVSERPGVVAADDITTWFTDQLRLPVHDDGLALAAVI